MGPCSASVTFSSREECDVDGIVERLARTVAADGNGCNEERRRKISSRG